MTGQVAADEVVPVRTRYPDDAGRALLDSMASPDVRLEMAVVANKFQPGELIEGIFTAEMPAALVPSNP